MRMSEERQRYLYCAISEPIMDMRVELEHHKQPITEADLFQLEQRICGRVADILGVQK